jgi:ABC-type polysaccharide/polyol phosphate transport system ATPase subunit
LFPAEVLPIVSVLANMVHFLLGLPILGLFLGYYAYVGVPPGVDGTPTITGVSLHAAELVWLPVVILVQLILTTGIALALSALTVHFRDVRDILANLLTFWFFATPIIYPIGSVPESARLLKLGLNLNPFTHLAVSYQEILFHPENAFGHLYWLLALGRGVLRGVSGGILALRPAARFIRGGGVVPSVPNKVAIELVNVTKVYRRYGSHHFATLKSALMQRSILQDLKPSETFHALTDVSISVPAGSTFGVIGRNGSGKSTALKLVAGITKPTSGTVSVKGRISALIELGAGFHPEISGRENVFINGIMLGLTKREIEKRFDEIVEFAELRDFIDEPVKAYSSGMYMRLGFSVAIHVDPEVLLVDEVLAVGDEGFTHKCLDKFADFKRRGKTVLLVTHSLGLVERLCDEAVWLDGGRKQIEGDPKRVVDAYVARVAQQEENFLASEEVKALQEQPAQAVDVPVMASDPTEDLTKAAEGRWGSRLVEISQVGLLDAKGHAAHVFQSGDSMRLHMRIRTRNRSTTSCLASGSSTPKASASTARIPTSRNSSRSPCPVTPRCSWRSRRST